ncbi:MAG: hypothetical protein R2695_09505 [Acidimicrobiales bacterium]
MRIGINFSNTTMLDSIEPVLESARSCDADGFAHWWLPQSGLLDALTVFGAAATVAPASRWAPQWCPRGCTHRTRWRPRPSPRRRSWATV